MDVFNKLGYISCASYVKSVAINYDVPEYIAEEMASDFLYNKDEVTEEDIEKFEDALLSLDL